jgi:hypothetical protein
MSLAATGALAQAPGGPIPGGAPPPIEDGYSSKPPAVVEAPPRPSEKLWAFSGFWKVDEWRPGLAPKGYVPFNDAFEAKRAELDRIQNTGGLPQGNEPRCIPNGPPMMMKLGFDIYVRGSRMVIATDRVTRFVDVGSKHTPADEIFPTFSGESIAHWEGDALVVDTIGLNKTNEIEWGVPNSGDMHIVERFRLLPEGRLEIKQQVIDPGALAKPWEVVRTYTRQPDLQPYEQAYCVTAIDRTRDPKTGQQGFDLTPPKGGYVPPDVK